MSTGQYSGRRVSVTTTAANYSDAPSAVASIDMVDSYVEMMYEGIPDKVLATKQVLSLAKQLHLLPALADNESLMSALSRVLSEDGRRSMDISFNILTFFFLFSIYTDFHPLLTRNKVGDSTIKTLERELERYEAWNTESMTGALDAEKSRKFKNMIKRQDQLIFICIQLLTNISQDINVQVKVVKREIIATLLNVLSMQAERIGASADSAALNSEVVVACLSFLEKLSTFKDCIADFLVENGKYLDVMILISSRSSNNAQLGDSSLKVLANLCHDPSTRQILSTKESNVKQILSVTTLALFDSPVWPLLQLLAREQDFRAACRNSNIIASVMKRIVDPVAKESTQLFIAIICQLMVDPESVPIVMGIAQEADKKSSAIKAVGLKMIMKQALKNCDQAFWKLIRTIFARSPAVYLAAFLPHLEDIIQLLLSCEKASLESLTQDSITADLWFILRSLNDIPEFDVNGLLTKYPDMLNVAAARLRHGLRQSVIQNNYKPTSKESNVQLPPSSHVDDDILLEAVQFIGMVAADAKCTDKLKELTFVHRSHASPTPTPSQARRPSNSNTGTSRNRSGSIGFAPLSGPVTVTTGTRPATRKMSMSAVRDHEDDIDHEQVQTSTVFGALMELCLYKNSDADLVTHCVQIIGHSLNLASVDMQQTILTEAATSGILNSLLRWLVHPVEGVRESAHLCLSAMESASLNVSSQFHSPSLKNITEWTIQIQALRFSVYHSRWIESVQDDLASESVALERSMNSNRSMNSSGRRSSVQLRNESPLQYT